MQGDRTPAGAPFFLMLRGRPLQDYLRSLPFGALRGQLGVPALPALVADFGLDPQLHKRFEAMSLGTRKKFMLVAGLASQARVVLMDEPTNGIDAEAKASLVEVFRRERERRLFLFSTHDGEAVAQPGARVLNLDRALEVRAG